MGLSIMSESGVAKQASAVPESYWQETETTRPLRFWRNLLDDALAYVPPPDRPPSRWGPYKVLVRIAVKSAGFRATLLYRLAHAACGHLRFPGRVMAGMLAWALRHGYGCTISHRARIYGGLVLPHPHGMVIGPGVIVGPRAWIFQNVTLGGAPQKNGMPWIGADARLSTGAVIVGPVRLGDNVFICANTLISADVASRTMVRPAEVVVSKLPERFLVGGGLAG
jgi:serine O-acetyltransferase